MRRRLIYFVFLLMLPAGPLMAQQQDTAAPVKRLAPRSAFIRSLIVPGWGQFSVHANTRGAIFVGLQGTSWFMLVKTINKLNDAKKVEKPFYDAAADSLRALMARNDSVARLYQNKEAFDARVKQDTAYISHHSLVASRTQQRQDWITYTLFTTLASGVDAYVAAQLADFPATISAQPRPDGGMQFRVTMPVPRKP